MPALKSKHQLATDAEVLATSYSYVRHGQITYIPVDFETGDDSVTPPPERTIWKPVTRDMLQQKAKNQFSTLFDSDAQLSSFEFMVAQSSTTVTGSSTSLLVRTKDGLKELKNDGKLHEPSGKFIPNALLPIVNDDADDKAEVLATLTSWLDSEEEAMSLIRHLATSLVPNWSAVRYVLLLGAGRNGKSLLMHMLQGIFGRENCSNVTRQDISDNSPVVTHLNGKLLNIVFDGVAVYLKDSGREKSLIAGETVGIRKLYSSDLTPVQTNALFIEGLNKEPKSSDKSSALQARIIRFWFPNVYEEDKEFWDRMTSERFIGALLALMIDNYVKPSEASVMLAPTAAALELQLEHMYENSLALQFIKYLDDTDPIGADVLLDMEFTELVKRFNSWRLKEHNELQSWPEPEVLNLFRASVMTERRSKRVNNMPRKVRHVVMFTRETRLFLATLRGDATHDSAAAVVED